MSLPGCAMIPGPYRERGQMGYATGKRIVAMVHENLRPSDIMTKQAFENAVVAAAALGASVELPDPYGGDRAAHGRGSHAGGLATARGRKSRCWWIASRLGGSSARRFIARAECRRC